MVSPGDLVIENLRRVRDRIERAATQAGRSPESIRLVGVAKYVGAEYAALLLEAGCRDLGESRPQQLWDKAADPRLADARWHLIGHLQRNKAARTVPLVECIHSLDSRRLLDAVEQAAAHHGRVVQGFLEINCSGEVQKHGLAPDEAGSLLADAEQWPHLQIVGLMTMASREGGAATAHRDFAALRNLRDQLRHQFARPQAWPELSMGMSGDLDEAIAEGATMVRVGSALWQGLR